MQPTVVIINGFPNAGKDETVKQTIIHLRSLGVEPSQISSIDPFRAAVDTLGLDPHDKTPAMRALLAEMKQSADRHFDYSTKALTSYCRDRFATAGERQAVFIHIREPHNIRKLREQLLTDPSQPAAALAVLTVMVQGNRSIRVDSNTADTGVEDFDYDVIMHNNGTIEELAEGCFDLACRIAAEPSKRSARGPAIDLGSAATD